jgi:RHS repeat-associated protein
VCASGNLAANGWCHQYGYDRWGNRRIAARVNDSVGLVEPASFNPATNRIADSIWQYEERGAVKKDPAGRSYGYDGESRMVATCNNGEVPCPAAWDVALVREFYTYDADGRRVRRDDKSGAQTVYVYDAAGQLAAEYATEGGNGLGVQYLTLDHLGSTRLVTDGSGAPTECHDYQPFGQEILATWGSPRSGVSCYGADTVRLKFTSKERDTETGLDYFGARYLSSAQGRFTSPDKPIMDQHIGEPQSWNLYVYARNNPLRYVDATGEAIELLGDEEQRKKELELLQRSMKSDEAAARLYINEVKDGDSTRYFVGIKGDVGEFKGLAATAKDLGNLVENKKVVEFGLTSRDLSRWAGAATFAPGEDGANKNTRVLVNPQQMNVTNRVLDPNTLLGATRFAGQNQRPSWSVWPFDTKIVTWHEFGHAYANITGTLLQNTNRKALDWENRMREQLYGPVVPGNAPRIAH